MVATKGTQASKILGTNKNCSFFTNTHWRWRVTPSGVGRNASGAVCSGAGSWAYYCENSGRRECYGKGGSFHCNDVFSDCFSRTSNDADDSFMASDRASPDGIP